MEKNVQELASTLLQADCKVENDIEGSECQEGDRQVDQGERERIDEGVVHRGTGLTENDRTLSEKCWDFSLGSQSCEEQGTKNRGR